MSIVLRRIDCVSLLVRCVCGREYVLKNKSAAKIRRQNRCRSCAERKGRPPRSRRVTKPRDVCMQCGDYRCVHGKLYEHPFVEDHATLMLYDAWAWRVSHEPGWSPNVIRVVLGLEPIYCSGRWRNSRGEEEEKALPSFLAARLLEEGSSQEEVAP